MQNGIKLNRKCDGKAFKFALVGFTHRTIQHTHSAFLFYNEKEHGYKGSEK